VCATFAVIAAFSIPEVRLLVAENYQQDGDTMYIPLNICMPNDVVLNGKTVDLSAGNETVDCHSLDFLINACAMSFCFSIAAIVVFFMAHMLARRGIGSTAAVGGMGLFLVFILLQTAVCTWALTSESNYWIRYFEEVLNDHFPEMGITHVDTHGNSRLLMATGVAAVASSFFLVLEALMGWCCSGSAATSSTGTSTSVEPKAPTPESTDSSNSGDDEESPESNEATSKPSWTIA